MKSAKVALVEIGGSHDECLLTQVEALAEAGVSILLVTTKAVYERNPALHPLIADFYFVETEGKAIADWRKMRKMVTFLKQKQVSKIVFNTAQGGHVRNLMVLLPASIECFGIIHTIRKFQGSFTQKVINRRIRKYLVLSDDLLKHITIPEGLSIKSFYPVSFPHFKKEVEKSADEVWITITGGVENRRKDLNAVIGFIQNTPSNCRFIFLGKTDQNKEDAQAFIREIEQNKLTDRVKWFAEFVDQETFDAVLRKTDLLLPLIHPHTQSAEQYISNQISGAFTISFSYKIPMLIHEQYKDQSDLAVSSFFYSLTDFSESLNKAIKDRKVMSDKIAATKKWSETFQKAHYLNFLGIKTEG